MSKKQTKRYPLRVFGAKALLRFLAWLPIGKARALGAFVGTLAVWFGSRHADFTRANLAHCYPNLTAQELADFTRKSVIESAKTSAEMGAAYLWKHKRVLELITHIENEALLDDAIAQKRGVILLAPHIGNWEIMGHFMAHKGQGRFITLYKPPKIADLEPLLKAARDGAGMISLPTNQKGIVRLFRELGNGALTAILPDQQPARKAGGVFAPFFGKPALTATLFSKAIEKTGALAVCGVALRDDKGFSLHFLEVDQELYSSDEQTSVAALNRSVERCIALAPAQYTWEYKRFRIQENGEDIYSKERRTKTDD
ncbi:lipid A biosynthesis lauroyl acyltransferase [Campylobacterota bacterium]|nr:lipid A biosynthesis lauroyl acyltransferase [Campylobacterota bacterium]